jgi:AhpD family alkylhydroperoxidase
MGLLMELKAQGNVGWRYIELAIVTVSKLNRCHYCVAHHTQPLVTEGIASETIALLPEHENNPGLDAADKLVVEYAVAVTENASRIPDRLFDRLREHFSEAQIVELTMRIALAGFFNRFNDALQIADELGEEVKA